MSRSEIAMSEPPRLSLFDIEAGWLPLMEARMDAEDLEDPEQRQQAITDADVALANHATAEVQKADGVIGFRRFLESIASNARQEKRRQEKRCALAENMLRQLDASVIYAMDAVNRKRIDGQRGALTVRNNGGVQPLIVDQPELLPDEFRDVSVTMPLPMFRGRFPETQQPDQRGVLPELRVGDVNPANSRIRAKLLEDCPNCLGRCTPSVSEVSMDCSACGGTGRNAIPGAYLGDRGRQVRVL